MSMKPFSNMILQHSAYFIKRDIDHRKRIFTKDIEKILYIDKWKHCILHIEIYFLYGIIR